MLGQEKSGFAAPKIDLTFFNTLVTAFPFCFVLLNFSAKCLGLSICSPATQFHCFAKLHFPAFSCNLAASNGFRISHVLSKCSFLVPFVTIK